MKSDRPPPPPFTAPIPELSRDAPPIPEMPDHPSYLELAKGYASTAAFILQQWPSLIKRFDDLEDKLDGVIQRRLPHSPFWMGVSIFLTIIVFVLMCILLRR